MLCLGKRYFVKVCTSDSTCQSFVTLTVKTVVNVCELAATTRMKPPLLLETVNDMKSD